MIFYFSGTGNSQCAAHHLGKQLGDEVVSINGALRKGERAAYQSQRALVFVAPTYCWRLPKVVERWIASTVFTGSRDAYFVLTCEGSCGNAAVSIKKLCEKKGLRFRGLSSVEMPENYLAMFPTPEEEQCREIVKQAIPKIAALGDTIKRGETFLAAPVTLADRMKSGPVQTLFYAFCVHDRAFVVSGSCVSCGKCAQRCPLGNITMKAGGPKWNGDCTHCMACISGCPTQAIEYGDKTKGRHRHFIFKD